MGVDQPYAEHLDSFFESEITKAVESNDLEKMREMLSKGIQIYNVKDTSKYANLLILSIQKNHLEMSKLLIDASAPLFSENQEGKCAYDLACPELKEYMDHVMEKRRQLLFQVAKQEKLEELVTKAVPEVLKIANRVNQKRVHLRISSVEGISLNLTKFKSIPINLEFQLFVTFIRCVLALISL